MIIIDYFDISNGKISYIGDNKRAYEIVGKNGQYELSVFKWKEYDDPDENDYQLDKKYVCSALHTAIEQIELMECVKEV